MAFVKNIYIWEKLFVALMEGLNYNTVLNIRNICDMLVSQRLKTKHFSRSSCLLSPSLDTCKPVFPLPFPPTLITINHKPTDVLQIDYYFTEFYFKIIG